MANAEAIPKVYTMSFAPAWIRRFVTFGLVAFYMSLDLFEAFTESETYAHEGILAFHHWIQVLVILSVLWSLVSELRLLQQAQTRLSEVQDRYARLSRDLSAHIDDQFSGWNMTEAEREVAWLLLKGFTFAEIALVRDVRETTLRQQASSLYEKAGVASRAELSALFLEEIMVRQSDSRT